MKTKLEVLLVVGLNLPAFWIAHGQSAPAATPLRLDMFLAKEGIELQVSGQTDSLVRIDYATGLADIDPWISLTNFTLLSSPTPVRDGFEANSTQKFYRGVVLRPANPDPEQLVSINPGTFQMGSPESDPDSDGWWERPQTEVTLTYGFFLSKYEVTQARYEAVMGTNASWFKGDSNRPVEMASWKDATNFCGKFNEQEQLRGRLPQGYAYRLPTEAEWEYAARAGASTRFSYGDDPGYTNLGAYAWYGDNSGGTTHPAGAKLPNAWGLYDMSGNVEEWCLDWLGDHLPGGSQVDPRGHSLEPAIRGGPYDLRASACRPARRGPVAPNSRLRYLGFRVALAPAEP